MISRMNKNLHPLFVLKFTLYLEGLLRYPLVPKSEQQSMWKCGLLHEVIFPFFQKYENMSDA